MPRKHSRPAEKVGGLTRTQIFQAMPGLLALKEKGSETTPVVKQKIKAPKKLLTPRPYFVIKGEPSVKPGMSDAEIQTRETGKIREGTCRQERALTLVKEGALKADEYTTNLDGYYAFSPRMLRVTTSFFDKDGRGVFQKGYRGAPHRVVRQVATREDRRTLANGGLFGNKSLTDTISIKARPSLVIPIAFDEPRVGSIWGSRHVLHHTTQMAESPEYFLPNQGQLCTKPKFTGLTPAFNVETQRQIVSKRKVPLALLTHRAAEWDKTQSFKPPVVVRFAPPPKPSLEILSEPITYKMSDSNILKPISKSIESNASVIRKPNTSETQNPYPYDEEACGNEMVEYDPERPEMNYSIPD
ncbi:unnamed protein product [Orchesella dallaii]|uniref:Sperm-tail PG-rich repeat-containing protein 2 n=1 Tax=Orchesella dallaii TaxID=48710 RepID=A0ABP1QWB2_9HEXA